MIVPLVYMIDASEEFHIPATSPEDLALLHFTSGTTGKPKGALHAHGAVIAHHATGRTALDLHPQDVFWPGLRSQASGREQIDLDSFDFLNVLIALNERLGVEVPEKDYAAVQTLNEMVHYFDQCCSEQHV